MNTPQDYITMSEDTLNLERNKLKIDSKRTRTLRVIANVTAICLLGLAFVSMVTAGMANAASTNFHLMLYIALSSALLSICAMLFGSFKENRQTNLAGHLTLLKPLSETSHCSTTLSLIELSPGARQHHSKVLAAGRQFYEFDYVAMQGIREQELREKADIDRAARAEIEAQACRKLHGIAA